MKLAYGHLAHFIGPKKINEMRRFGRYIIILTTLMLGTLAQAQDEAVFDSLSIGDQFDYVLKKSNKFEQFKVVRIRHMDILKQSSLDSLKQLHKTIDVNVSEISQLKNEQDNLNKQIAGLDEQLESITKSKDSINFFGQEIQKSVYNTVMWGLVFALAAVAVVLFTLFKRSNAITKETKSRLSEVEEEYENHRKSALKREQKLARELMDIKVKNKL